MKKFIYIFTGLLIFFYLNCSAIKSQTWSPLGSGMNNTVMSFTVYNNKLITGGYFSNAGGVSANRVARWNDTSWAALGSVFIGAVFALTVYNNELIAGGQFDESGGLRHVAKWNGSSWSALGNGLDNDVWALTVYNNELIAGGNFSFDTVGTPRCIGKWNGSNWVPLGNGMLFPGNTAYVFSLIVYNNELIAGGAFTNAGGVSANFIAKWNGTTWSPLGSGLNLTVRSLCIYNNELIAGGYFHTSGGKDVNNIAKWNGTSWDSLGSGLNDYVYSLSVYQGELIVGGQFSYAGSVPANRIAKWNGTSWSSLGSGVSGSGPSLWIRAINIYNNKLFVGGEFTSAGGINANNIAKWTAIYHDISSGPFLNLPTILHTNTQYSIKTKVSNFGAFNESSIPVKFFINGSLISTTNINLNIGQFDSVSNNWTPTSSGTYNLMYVATAPLDTNRINDTVRVPVNVTITGIVNKNEIPATYNLSQNYPNPFNPSTKINFDIPQDSPEGHRGNDNVLLVVYDILGNEVSTLVNEQLKPGTYEVEWDGSNYASGIYYYKLIAGDFVETKRMVLLK